MAKCKITVLRRMLNQDFADEFCADKFFESDAPLCPVFVEGQEFLVDENQEKPESFCVAAWDDMYKYVFTLLQQGTFRGWMKEDGMNIVCCTNGVRPVVFKLGRIDE